MTDCHFGSYNDTETECRDCVSGKDLLNTEPQRDFYYHRATKQTQWDPPQGWDQERANKHRTSSRKLLSTYAGEGRLCHPDTTVSGVGRPSPDYPPDGPVLQDCPGMYICIHTLYRESVCVCVREREREKERDAHTS